MFQRHLGALALAAALIVPVAASAQSAPAPAAPAVAAPGAPGAQSQRGHHRHHRRHGFMHAMRGLNLTDTQKQQLAGIFKSARAARRQTAGTTPDPATRRANMQAMRAQIDGILTDTQRAKLAENLKREHHMKNGDAQGQVRPPQSTPQ